MSGKRPEARLGDVVKIGRTGLKLYAVMAIVRPHPGLNKRHRRAAVAFLGNGRKVKLARLIVVTTKAKGKR